MEQIFKGRHMVVSGAGRDFGRTLAMNMAKLGATVHLSARTLEKAQATADLIRARGGQVFADSCDMSNLSEVTRWANAVSERTSSLSYLFLNAGRYEHETELDRISDEDIEDIVLSSLTGSIVLMKACLPLLRAADQADVIAMVSSCALPNYTDSAANPAFYAAKHGLSGFCDIMSARLRPEGIRVTALYPTDFDNVDPDSEDWADNRSPDGLLTSRTIWEAIDYVLRQPHAVSIDKILFSGKRWDQA